MATVFLIPPSICQGLLTVEAKGYCDLEDLLWWWWQVGGVVQDVYTEDFAQEGLKLNEPDDGARPALGPMCFCETRFLGFSPYMSNLRTLSPENRPDATCNPVGKGKLKHVAVCLGGFLGKVEEFGGIKGIC